jgi:hypothetical protein
VAKTVTLTNSGSAALSITSVLASGDFAQTNNCPSGSSTLAAGANCAVNVTFTPSVPGKILGEITIADNASGTPHLVNLSGTGLAPISVSPASLSFGTVTVGTTTAGKVFTLTNNSSGSLTLSLTSSAGYNVAGSGTSPCGSSLAAKAKCTATVTFAPRTNGAINGAVSVSYGSIFSPQQVTLTGTGSGGATSPLTFKPASLSFAAQLIGTTSPSKTVTVTNSSTGSVTVSSLSAIGNYSVASTGTTPCAGAVLAAGGTCTFAITFNPTYPGTVKGGIAIANSTAVSPEVFNVSGSAALPLGFSPTSLTFPAQTVGTTSAGKTVTLSNNQSTSATISLVATGQFAVSGSGSSPCAASLAAHSKCTFAVTFSPSVVGTVKAVVTLNYGSSFSPVELNLSGTGQ